MLKNVNRQLFFCSGIYAIYSKKYGKIYVGSSINVYKRINDHINKLERNRHHNQPLQNFYNKYGKKSLEALVLGIFSGISLKELRKEEQKYIDLYFDKKYCFNLSKKADYFYRTEDQNKKHGKFLKNFWADNYDTQKEIVCNNLKKAKVAYTSMIADGIKFTSGMKGRKHSKESREKQSESAKNRKTINAVCVAVNMLDLHGNILDTFISAKHAARCIAGNYKLSSNILAVCEGKRRRACGHFWEYALKPAKVNIGQVWAGKDLFKAYFDKNNAGIIVKAKNETAAKKLLKKLLTIEKGENMLYCDIKPRRLCAEDAWARRINCLWKRH